MAEKLALHQTVRNGGTIDGHKRSVAALAQGVHQFPGQLLAGAGLPGNEDVAVGGRGPRTWIKTFCRAGLLPINWGPCLLSSTSPGATLKGLGAASSRRTAWFKSSTAIGQVKKSRMPLLKAANKVVVVSSLAKRIIGNRASSCSSSWANLRLHRQLGVKSPRITNWGRHRRTSSGTSAGSLWEATAKPWACNRSSSQPPRSWVSGTINNKGPITGAPIRLPAVGHGWELNDLVSA